MTIELVAALPYYFNEQERLNAMRKYKSYHYYTLYYIGGREGGGEEGAEEPHFSAKANKEPFKN